MSLHEALEALMQYVVKATIEAPDAYPDWDTGGYPDHRSQLLLYWSEAKPKIKRDTDEVAFIDAKLEQALASFDRGEREPGQKLMFEIYNVLNLNRLR